MPTIPALGRLKQKNHNEFVWHLDHIVSSRPASPLSRPCLKRKTAMGGSVHLWLKQVGGKGRRVGSPRLPATERSWGHLGLHETAKHDNNKSRQQGGEASYSLQRHKMIGFPERDPSSCRPPTNNAIKLWLIRALRIQPLPQSSGNRQPIPYQHIKMSLPGSFNYKTKQP